MIERQATSNVIKSSIRSLWLDGRGHHANACRTLSLSLSSTLASITYSSSPQEARKLHRLLLRKEKHKLSVMSVIIQNVRPVDTISTWVNSDFWRRARALCQRNRQSDTLRAWLFCNTRRGFHNCDADVSASVMFLYVAKNNFFFLQIVKYSYYVFLKLISDNIFSSWLRLSSATVVAPETSSNKTTIYLWRLDRNRGRKKKCRLISYFILLLINWSSCEKLSEWKLPAFISNVSPRREKDCIYWLILWDKHRRANCWYI